VSRSNGKRASHKNCNVCWTTTTLLAVKLSRLPLCAVRISYHRYTYVSHPSPFYIILSHNRRHRWMYGRWTMSPRPSRWRGRENCKSVSRTQGYVESLSSFHAVSYFCFQHDLIGRSSSPGSLALWTHNLQNVRVVSYTRRLSLLTARLNR
jgi:hypothetical protein